MFMLTRNNRVVVTGIGVVAPNGIGKEAFWDTLVAGRSGIGPVTLFDASQHTCRIAGEVKNFDPIIHLGTGISYKRLARQSQLALAATFQALSDARLTQETLATTLGIPLVLGVSSSAIEVIEQGMARMTAKGPGRVPTHIVHGCQPHQAASTIVRHIPWLTSSSTIASACAAGLDAIASATDLIRQGRADVAICGGTDAPINALTLACLAQGGMISHHNIPAKASSPFSSDRNTGIISEGSGILILESLNHARARGATPYLEITGYATHTDPHPDQPESGLASTIIASLANAQHRVADVDYICAHGPSDRTLDLLETNVIKTVFGQRAYQIPITSIKGVTGNPLSAAGPLQVITCALIFLNNRIPPTANLDKPDPDCDLDYVPTTARHFSPQCILINSHGLGGGNSCLVVERVGVE
ncbi:MAG: beta-ketoacyl-[acyl-carrier-protein] synthase family protein [bacterium]